MNTRYTTVNLDVSQQGSIPSITLSQYDLGVGLSFYIMDGGLPYSAFAETDMVVLSGTKPSGVGFTIPAYYKSENLCSFKTTQAMTTEAGTVTCEITITKVNNISVSTANFFVEVEASAHAHETVDEDIEDFSLIANQVGEYKAVAVRAAQQAAQSATDAAASASSAEESMEAAQAAASSAIAAKDDIQEYIDDSEAWARGTRGGEAVSSTDETYENNAKYYAEQSSQASMDAGVSATEAEASAQQAAASVVGAVKYTAQSLTTEQKAQARTNIGAASPSDIPSGTVRYDTAQSLTDAQRTQAKNNIGVPSIDATLAVTGAAADAKKVGDELTDIRGDLSDALSDVTLTPLVFQYSNQYVDVSGTTANINNKIANQYYNLCIQECTEGDVFVINAQGGGAPRAYAFLNSSGTVLEVAESSERVQNKRVTAPSGSTVLIIHDSTSTSGGVSYKYSAVNIIDNVVRFDKQQALTTVQKQQVKENIGIEDVDGLTDFAKASLLNLVRGLGFGSATGEMYGRVLRAALYSDIVPKDTDQLYSIVNDTAFDGIKDMLHTAVNPFYKDQDWSVVYDITEEPPLYEVSQQRTPIFFMCMEATNPWPGLQILRRPYVQNDVAVWGHQINCFNLTGIYYGSNADMYNSHRIKVAITHSHGNAPVIALFNIDSQDKVVTWSAETFNFVEFSKMLYATIGNGYNPLTDRRYDMNWRGIVHSLFIYKRVLTSGEIDALIRDKEIDDTLLYSAPSGMVLNGINEIIDTGISIFGSDVNWTLLYDIIENPPTYQVTDSHTPVLFTCMKMQNPYPGVQIVRRPYQGDTTSWNHQINLWTMVYRFTGTVAEANTSHRIKIAITHTAGNAPQISYATIDGLTRQYATYGTYTFTPFENTITGKIDNANHRWNGVINTFKIYNRALTLAEINKIMGEV